MALTRVVSEIFNVKRCHKLEIPVKGQSRKELESVTIGQIWYGFSISVL